MAGEGVCSLYCPGVKMNTTEFLASLESLTTLGLDDLNYDSIWDHPDTTEEEEVVEEEMKEEELADKDELEGITEASTRS